MKDLCRFVEESGPTVWPTRGTLHPVMLLHWRVQYYILGGLPGAVRDSTSGSWPESMWGVAVWRTTPIAGRGPRRPLGEAQEARGLSLEPRPASGTLMEREPLWDRNLGETFHPWARADSFSFGSAGDAGWEGLPVRVRILPPPRRCSGRSTPGRSGYR
jgi:hypothetical protein